MQDNRSGPSRLGIDRARRFTRDMLGLGQARESPHNKVKTIEQLLSRFQITDAGCHEWTGSTNGKGYGVMLLGGGSKDKKILMLAHRLQWMHHHGPLEKGQIVMHRCDNTRCIRIEHLQSGTQLENMHDMIAKGRHNYSGLLYSAESAQKRGRNALDDDLPF